MDNDNKTIIEIADQKISLREINSYQLPFSLPKNYNGIVVHKAKPTITFVQNFYYLFIKKIPQAIISENISEYDLCCIKSMIGKHCFLDNNEITFFDDNVKHNPITSLILFTSGSSGAIKAVQLSFDNIISNVDSVINTLDLQEIESQILFLPLHYSYGLLGQLLPAIFLKKKTHLYSSLYDIKDRLSDIPTSLISGVPQHYQIMFQLFGEKKFESIKKVVSAGSFLSSEERLKVKNMFPNADIYNNYGQTELSPRALVLSSKENNFFTNATGKVVPNLEAKICEDGELAFKGKQLMLGYLGGPELNNETWWYTGDYATVENDIYTVLGRKDDIIKVNGERHSLVSLSNKVKLYPEIDDAIIIQDECDSYNRNLIGFVILKNSYSKDNFKKFLLKTFPSSIIPKVMYSVESFPKLSSGKIDRVKIRTDLNLRKNLCI